MLETKNGATWDQGLRKPPEDAETKAHGMMSCITNLEPTCAKQLATLILWPMEETFKLDAIAPYTRSRTVFSSGKAGTVMAQG